MHNTELEELLVDTAYEDAQWHFENGACCKDAQWHFENGVCSHITDSDSYFGVAVLIDPASDDYAMAKTEYCLAFQDALDQLSSGRRSLLDDLIESYLADMWHASAGCNAQE